MIFFGGGALNLLDLTCTTVQCIHITQMIYFILASLGKPNDEFIELHIGQHETSITHRTYLILKSESRSDTEPRFTVK